MVSNSLKELTPGLWFESILVSYSEAVVRDTSCIGSTYIVGSSPTSPTNCDKHWRVAKLVDARKETRSYIYSQKNWSVGPAGVDACLSRRRSRVRVPYGPPIHTDCRITVEYAALSMRRSGFESPSRCQFALLVQRIEHLTTDQEIGVRISYGVQ